MGTQQKMKVRAEIDIKSTRVLKISFLLLSEPFQLISAFCVTGIIHLT